MYTFGETLDVVGEHSVLEGGLAEGRVTVVGGVIVPQASGAGVQQGRHGVQQ